ncbi:MAG TPA: PAS domain-containing protein [Methanoregulaceae archaeon]|nr:PAS domain-containing protein [Methanoregulaceae archaeon]
MEASRDVIYRCNPATGRFEYFSPASREIVGYAPDELMALDNETALSMIHPDDLSLMRTAIAEIEVAGHAAGEYRQRTKTGGYRWICNNMSLIRDSAGSSLYRVGTIRDITDRKQAEMALQDYTKHLRRSNEDLERFAYASSHDLQEPLRSIVSFAQLLERRYTGRLDPDADEYIHFIVEGGHRMQSLILNLLAYSRVNTTEQGLTPTAIEDVLAAVERNLALQLDEAGATLRYDPMPTVMADPMLLEQVFTTLVSNTIKFRRLEMPLRIHIGVRRLDGLFEFSVSDNRIGIEAEFRDRIFVIFNRLLTKDAYPGTGIGLAIVKRIIDRHSCRVWVESTPGEGSTFFFTLPALS